LQRAGYRKETQKVSAEGERSNVLYCMYNTLQSGQVAKEKDAPCSKGTDQHVSIRSKINLRATVQYGVSGLDKQLQLFRSLCTNMAAPQTLDLIKQQFHVFYLPFRHGAHWCKCRENSSIYARK
jgi:hypothetical protein